MTTTVDARGLSCPQPVILTLNAIKKENDAEIIVLVDTDTARENVTRAAESRNYMLREALPEEDGYRIIFTKG